MGVTLNTNFDFKSDVPNFARDVIYTGYIDFRPHVHILNDTDVISVEADMYEDGHIVYFPNFYSRQLTSDKKPPKHGGAFYKWNININDNKVYDSSSDFVRGSCTNGEWTNNHKRNDEVVYGRWDKVETLQNISILDFENTTANSVEYVSILFNKLIDEHGNNNLIINCSNFNITKFSLGYILIRFAHYLAFYGYTNGKLEINLSNGHIEFNSGGMEDIYNTDTQISEENVIADEKLLSKNNINCKRLGWPSDYTNEINVFRKYTIEISNINVDTALIHLLTNEFTTIDSMFKNYFVKNNNEDISKFFDGFNAIVKHESYNI